MPFNKFWFWFCYFYYYSWTDQFEVYPIPFRVLFRPNSMALGLYQGFKCWFRTFGPSFDRLCICLIARQVEVIWVLPYLFPIYPARHHLRNSNTWFYILFHVLKNEIKRFLRTLRIKCYYSSIMLTNTYWLSQKLWREQRPFLKFANWPWGRVSGLGKSP